MNWNIGIDIGGCTARMAVKGRGLVLRESSLVACRGGAPFAQGDEALDMLGRAPGGVEIASPMAGASIAREALLSHWLRYLIRQAAASGLARRAHLLIARPPEMEASQKKRLVAMAMEAGAASCALLRSDFAAAIGCGWNPAAAGGFLLVDLGASRMGASLLSFGRCVHLHTLPYGASAGDGPVERLLRDEYGLIIGPKSAAALRVAQSGAPIGAEGVFEDAAGLLARTGFPARVRVRADQLRAASAFVPAAAAELARAAVLSAPDGFSEDLMESGVTLTGGGASAFALDKLVEERTGLSCRVAEDPSCCVARGLAAFMDGDDSLSRLTEERATILERRLPGLR